MKQETWYIGVDLHKSQFTICIQNEKGKEQNNVYYFSKGGMEQFKSFLTCTKADGIATHIAVETTGNSEYFYNETNNLVKDIIVLNTLKTKQLIKSHKKTDKNDARAIATLLRKDIFTEEYRVHTPSQVAKDLRRLHKMRTKMKQFMTGTKNMIHGILLGEGEETKKRFLNSQKGRDRLRAMNYESQSVLNTFLNTLETLIDEVTAIEHQINEKAAERADDVARVKTVTGIGDVIATAIVGAVDDINRFKNAEAFAAYFGLVPFVNNSSDEVRHGRITKTGPKLIRTVLVQAIFAMVRSDRERKTPLVREYYRRKEQKGAGKAVVACARKLATILFAMLKNKTDFGPYYRIHKQA